MPRRYPDRPTRHPIRAADRNGNVVTFRPGTVVRVYPDVGPDGRHPLDRNGQGFYLDTVRATYVALVDAAPSFDAPAALVNAPAVVLTRSSWNLCIRLEHARLHDNDGDTYVAWTYVDGERRSAYRLVEPAAEVLPW